MRSGAASEPCLEELWVLHEAFPDVTQRCEQTDHPFQLEVCLSTQCLVFDLTERLHQKGILMSLAFRGPLQLQRGSNGPFR